MRQTDGRGQMWTPPLHVDLLDSPLCKYSTYQTDYVFLKSTKFSTHPHHLVHIFTDIVLLAPLCMWALTTTYRSFLACMCMVLSLYEASYA